MHGVVTKQWLQAQQHSKSLATAGAGGSKVTYYASCTSNMFAWNTEQQTAASNKEGMVCPGLLINRPSTVTNQSAAFYNNIVLSDPLVYSYQGCNCTAPLVAHYSNDSGTLHKH